WRASEPAQAAGWGEGPAPPLRRAAGDRGRARHDRRVRAAVLDERARPDIDGAAPAVREPAELVVDAGRASSSSGHRAQGRAEPAAGQVARPARGFRNAEPA